LGTSAVPVVDRLEPPDRSRGRPVVAAGRADAEAALDVLDEPTPVVSVPAPEWQPSRDVPVQIVSQCCGEKHQDAQNVSRNSKPAFGERRQQHHHEQRHNKDSQ